MEIRQQKIIRINLLPEEWEYLNLQVSRWDGLSLSEYIRACAFDRPIAAIPKGGCEIKSLNRSLLTALIKIQTNLTQSITAIHSLAQEDVTDISRVESVLSNLKKQLKWLQNSCLTNCDNERKKLSDNCKIPRRIKADSIRVLRVRLTEEELHLVRLARQNLHLTRSRYFRYKLINVLYSPNSIYQVKPIKISQAIDIFNRLGQDINYYTHEFNIATNANRYISPQAIGEYMDYLEVLNGKISEIDSIYS
jgi:CRISPR/Cas system-associated endoribonuclease Cas2